MKLANMTYFILVFGHYNLIITYLVDSLQMYENIERPSVSKMAHLIKVVNLATGGLIVAFGLVGIIYMAIQKLLSLEFFLVFSPLFMICFGIVLVSIQMKATYILQNFGFLRSLTGRGIFNIYLSSQVYYYFGCASGNTVLAWVSAMVLLGLGVLYLFLNYCDGGEYSNRLKEQLS